MTLDSYWPTEPNPDRPDRKAYYDEQERLRKIEQKKPLADFDEAALREAVKRLFAPILSIDKELK